jgi:disulfide bond formation protein DsbB
MNIYLFQKILGIGTLGIHIAILAIIVLIATKRDRFFSRWVHQHGFNIGFIFATLSLIMSLIFSDVYLVEPCKLCWIQRICHYPLVLIFLIGWKYKDPRAWTYSFWLSIIGLYFAIRQIFLQFNISDGSTADCVVGPGADCSAVHMLEFGYITFPLMSATLFVCVILLSLVYFRYKKPHQK